MDKLYLSKWWQNYLPKVILILKLIKIKIYRTSENNLLKV